MRYSTCGISLDSDVPLPELGRARHPHPSCSFHLLPARRTSHASVPSLFERKLRNGRTWLSVAKDTDGFLLRYPGYADFRLTADARDICCIPSPDTPLTTIRHLLLDQVLPLALTAIGRLTLHAGAVEIDGKAIVLLGKSGAGKSTLVAALCQRGGTMLADDCVVVRDEQDTPYALPSYAGLRLWPKSVSALYEKDAPTKIVAHYTFKRRVTPKNGNGAQEAEVEAVPIGTIYRLDPLENSTDADSVAPVATMVQMPRREACMELVKSVFQLDVTDPAATCRSFAQVSRLAVLRSISRVQYVKDFDRLPALVDAVLAGHLP